MKVFKKRHALEQTTHHMRVTHSRVEMSKVLLALGVPREEAFGVATGRRTLSLTLPEAHRLLKAVQEARIPRSSFWISPEVTDT